MMNKAEQFNTLFATKRIMIQSSRAVVIKTIEYGESSKIVTMLTEEHGKIAFIARGARKSKSAYAAKLQVGQMLDLVYYYKPTRSVQNLKEVSYWNRLENIYQDFEKWGVIIAVCEMVDQLVQEGEVNGEMFSFITALLPWFEEAEVEPKKVFPYIQVRLADMNGIGIQWMAPVKQVQNQEEAGNSPNTSLYLNVTEGAVTEAATDKRSLHLTENKQLYLYLAIHSRNPAMFTINFSNEELNSLIHDLDQYLGYHIEDLKPRRSDSIFQQFL